MESEKYQADIGGLHLQSEKHERQRPQLFQGEYAQVLRASQDDQGCEMKEETEGPNGASREAEERREQREVSAYRLEQVIDEQGRSEITRGRDDVGCDPQSKQGFVRQDVGRCGCGVAGYNKPAANEHGEGPHHYGHQPEGSGSSGFETRRHSCNPFVHLIASRRGRHMNAATPNTTTTIKKVSWSPFLSDGRTDREEVR